MIEELKLSFTEFLFIKSNLEQTRRLINCLTILDCNGDRIDYITLLKMIKDYGRDK